MLLLLLLLLMLFILVQTSLLYDAATHRGILIDCYQFMQLVQ